MPHFDIWNNPIVVSAFRVKYRRGGLFVMTVLYLFVLASVALGLMYYQIVNEFETGRKWPYPWQHIFLLGVLGLQYLVSGGIALGTTATSMRAEVSNRTLDFQRIAALSPLDILLGKLFGEPALAYLLIIALFPLPFLCILLGVRGVGPVEVLLVFVNLFTTTILLGSFGVQTTLHPKPGKSGGQQGNPGLGFLIGMVVFAGQMAGTGGAGWLSKPWSSALLGLVTPVPILYGMGAGDPWGYGLWFFGGRVPFLLVSPVFHLALAALSLHSMARRMVNPQNPALSKPVAYLSLAVVDLLIAGVIYGDPRPGFGYQLAPAPRIALFCLLHLVATLVALFCVTPPRETLETWVWRYRGRMPLWRDWLIGERSENGLALVVCAAIGLLVGVLGVVLPCAPDEVQAVAGRIALCLGTTCLIILTYGTLLQWMVVVGKRQGMALFILAVVLANALPAGAGLYLKVQQEESGRKRGREVDPDEWNLLLEMSPAVQYGSWMADDRQLKQRPNPLPVLIPYAAALGLLYWDLRRRVRWLERRIDTKLEGMGIVPYAVAVEAG